MAFRRGKLLFGKHVMVLYMPIFQFALEPWTQIEWLILQLSYCSKYNLSTTVHKFELEHRKKLHPLSLQQCLPHFIFCKKHYKFELEHPNRKLHLFRFFSRYNTASPILSSVTFPYRNIINLNLNTEKTASKH